uniref:Pectinesterase inhibitor 1 n=1 Tax=Cajanus cajan TaxID=3821 RepID=A0A151SML3_CAJCA|nr:Pectinesterase inhibitor 1 [Cajanus cajan]
MAYNFSPFVLVFFLFTTSSYAISPGEINAICKQTRNPSFCVTLLNSKPSANFVTLAQYTINVAHDKVIDTINLINSLIKSADNSETKDHYTLCLVHFSFEGALGQVLYTQEMLKKGDYEGVNVGASGILTNVDDCILGDSPSDPRFPDPSMLPKYADVVDSIADIILSISRYLVH